MSYALTSPQAALAPVLQTSGASFESRKGTHSCEGATIAYRRRNESNTWHWCENCSNWPTTPRTYVERRDEPKSRELCEECSGLQNKGNCTGP